MRSRSLLVTIVLGVLAIVAISGCDSNPTNPLSAFQPEIVNNPDNFAFQATAAQNVSTTLTYTWLNSGTQASVDHSTSPTSGVASVAIYDSNDSLVYTHGLMPSGNESSLAGEAGSWSIVVTFDKYYGTVKFRVQKL